MRFATSAAWETVAAVRAVNHASARAIHRGLSRDLDQRTRRAMNVLGTLLQVPRWTPHILAPAPITGVDGWNDIERVVDTPNCVVESDLAILSEHGARPWASMTPDHYRDVVNHCLNLIWAERVAPLWNAVSETHAADVRWRVTLLAGNGVGAVLNSLHPDVSYNREVVDLRLPRCDVAMFSDGRGIVLMPTVFRWPQVVLSHDAPGPIVISYPALGAGTVWSSQRRGGEDRLAALIGSSRALLLLDLDSRRTTTELSTRHQLAPATVSEHLSILSSARLVSSERCGKRVFYYRTSLGSRLLDGQENDAWAG